MNDVPTGYTEHCVPECFEFGGTVGCPGWTHPDKDRRKGSRRPGVIVELPPLGGPRMDFDPNDIHPDFDFSNPAPAPQAYVRDGRKKQGRRQFGLVENGNMPLELAHRVAQAWGGQVIVPREAV